TSTLVGKSIGAGDIEEAKKITTKSLWIMMASLTIAGVILFIFSEYAIQIFVPDSPDVISGGSNFVRIIALTFGFIGIQQVVGGAFRGGGNTTLAMLLAVVSLWVFRFPIAYLLSFHTSLKINGI